MNISKDNIGDIIVLETGNRILIENVDDKYITYRNENGGKYATDEYNINGYVERDPEKTKIFHRHCEVGKFLRAAETSAFNKIFSAYSSQEDLAEAGSVLKSVRNHQSALVARIREENNGRQAPSDLDSLIRNAHLKQQNQMQNKEPFKNKEKIFGR